MDDLCMRGIHEWYLVKTSKVGEKYLQVRLVSLTIKKYYLLKNSKNDFCLSKSWTYFLLSVI